ncbi:MAG: alpha/beta hydrolase [Candidatus Nanopelagicales bacterium]
MSLMPGSEPFSADGGPVATLLIHGFTSTPQSMRPWGRYLGERGYTVRIPRLPGHGTSWREANLTTWEDWYAEVDRVFGELHADHRVFVLGQSMGGTLALRLAEQRPSELAGLILANPSVHTENKLSKATAAVSRVSPIWVNIAGDVKKIGAEPELAYNRMPLRAFVSLQRLWPLVKADIARIVAPTLLFNSTVDHVVEPSNGDWVAANLQVDDFTRVQYDNSYHLLTLDNDAEAMFAASVEFIERLTG